MKPLTQFLIIVALAQACHMAIAVDLHVSPEGNDVWTGTLEKPNPARTDGPLASPLGARDAIRKLHAAGTPRQPIRVLIQAGQYHLGEPLVFEPRDSGTEQCPIRYCGDPAARPILSGGRQVTGWRKQDDRWVAHLPEVEAGQWNFAALWVNGERRTRARMPNEDFFYTAGKAPPITDRKTGKPASSAHLAFRFKPGDIRPSSRLDDAVVVVYQSWEVGHQRIASLDEAKRIVTFRSPLPWAFDHWGGNVRYFVENVPEALDAPGEWYLDRKTGLLSYFPLPGEDLTQATVVAPVAKQLIVLRGKPAENQFVSYLQFENLRLQFTDWEVPPQGHAAGQAACDFPGAIEAVGARYCSVEGCELAHLGTYGVWLRFGCQDNRIARNRIHDLGAGGVRLGEQSNPPTAPEVAQRNIVDNNLIHDGGKIDPGAVGVWIGRTSHNRVSHNEICDLYYTGISVGWSWGYAPSSAHHNLVEFNHIHNIGRGVLGDMGGIYCLGDSPGTVIRNNLVHDVYDHHTGSLAIYTDEGSTGILIENNIGYGTTYANFHQHYGKENIVRNNIWALGKDYQLSRARQEEHISFTFERNIVYFNNGKLLKGGWTNDKFVMDRNLYWDTSHPDGDIQFAGATLAEWQARGHDRHSLIADPKFVDADHFDFRLQADSPAFQLGFVPIDVGQIGLYGDPEWVALPRQIQREPYVPKPRPEPGPKPVEDDFEDSLSDMPPEDATVSVEGLGSILVTGELAAEGKQSLKFSDAAGQKYSFNPHLWYSPRLVAGKVRGSVDVRIEPGAVGHFEWRDYAGGAYRVGPSVRIDGDGKLLSGGKLLGKVPLSRWLRIEITCGLGETADGKWMLRYGPSGGELAQVELTCDPQFRKLDWAGFIADATVAAAFYVDNVKIGPSPVP
ncbi:MAG: right-handed parallel beta-helix repeat-containing protein [Rhodopirellula sp.]|nr:right-handed parallel beta-helix repeat-containing protein [Rhodopirellula sp.]